jgi:hypothetical protein
MIAFYILPDLPLPHQASRLIQPTARSLPQSAAKTRKWSLTSEGVAAGALGLAFGHRIAPGNAGIW